MNLKDVRGKLGSRSPSMPKTNMRMPRFLTDLWADLRERHLLPVAVILLVAIPAIPILLSSSGSSAPTSTPASSGSIPKDSQAKVAVLAQGDPGVREYRDRLSGRAENDPFKQPAAAGSGQGSNTGSQLSVVPSATGTASAPSGGNTGGGGGTGGKGVAPVQPQPDVTFVTYAVDTEVGEPGNLANRNDLKLFELLPNESKPIFVFAGLSGDAKRAYFMVSNLVSISGSGVCVVTVNVCQLLALKEGDQEDVVSLSDLKTYRIKVTAIRKVTG